MVWLRALALGDRMKASCRVCWIGTIHIKSKPKQNGKKCKHEKMGKT